MKARWKLLGLAGVAGVAATGVVIARAQRQRRALEPEDVRARLHARLGVAGEADGPAVDAVADRRAAVLAAWAEVRARVAALGDRVREALGRVAGSAAGR